VERRIDLDGWTTLVFVRPRQNPPLPGGGSASGAKPGGAVRRRPHPEPR
jgi:hypothetical protein